MARFEKGNNSGKRFPEQSIAGNGRKPVKKFREILEELSQDDYKMTFPLSAAKIDHEKQTVTIALPSDVAIATNLKNMSANSVKWFEQYAKVVGLYAPTKTAETDSEGNDIPRNITVTIVR